MLHVFLNSDVCGLFADQYCYFQYIHDHVINVICQVSYQIHCTALNIHKPHEEFTPVTLSYEIGLNE